MIYTYSDLHRILGGKYYQQIPNIMWRTGPYKASSIPSRL